MKQSRDLALRFLALRGVAFRKTHDLAKLLDLMEEHGLSPLPLADSLDELNPYGVVLCYEWGDTDMLDRKRALSVAMTVRDWAVGRTEGMRGGDARSRSPFAPGSYSTQQLMVDTSRRNAWAAILIASV